jgi:uncharacterized protein YjbI with pentapeptide repeats
MWKAAADQLGPETPLDLAMPKPRGEVIVAGKAFALGGPKAAVSVRVRCASVDKRLTVIGDRTWQVTGMTTPQPFTAMPVTWERAFGGEGFAKNPLGRGLGPVGVGGAEIHALPNVEDPDRLISAQGDKPDPVGLLPMDQTWPERAARVGTYDGAWQKKRFPWFPEDFDWEFYNVAPPDQRIEGYFTGGEDYAIEGMHPDKAVVRGQLPAGVPRVFILKKSAPDEIVYLESHMDTIVLFPNIERGVVVYRTSTPVDEDDANDVSHVLAAFEDPLAARRPHAHYLQVLRLREDREKAAMYALRDKDLLPAWPKPTAPLPEDKWSDHPELVKTEQLSMAYMERKALAAWQDARKLAAERGSPLPEERPRADYPPPPEDLDELAEYFEGVLQFADGKQKELEKMRDQAYDEARARLAEKNIDFDRIVEQAKLGGGGPPEDLRAAKQIERLQATAELARNAGRDVAKLLAQIEDPTVLAKLAQVEKAVFEAYRTYTHFYPAAAEVPPAVRGERRALLVASADAKEPVHDKNFTGADLAGLDLSGADLSGGLFEAADLRGARLVGARLAGATFARADLRGADFTGADLSNANLSQTRLDRAVLDDARLDDVWFWETEMGGASMKRVKLTGNALFGAKGGEVDLSGATLELMNVFEIDLVGAKLAGARLRLVGMLRVNLDGADLTGADLQQVGFVECSGKAAKLDRARLERTVFALGTSFAAATFVGAKVRHSSFRACDFSACDFTGAVADECDFGETNLAGARLYHASANQSIFVRADLSNADVRGAKLMNALLGKAKVPGADFRGANLFRADMARARGDAETTLEDAYVVQVRTAPDLDRPKGAV